MNEAPFLTPQLAQALSKIGEQKTAMLADLDIRDLKRRIVVLDQQLREAQAMLQQAERPYRAVIEELLPYAQAQALEYGYSCDHAGITVKYRKGYIRTTFPTEQVVRLIGKVQQTHPDIASRFRKLAKTTEVPPSVTIEVE